MHRYWPVSWGPITIQGSAGYGRPTRWRLTETARAWLAEGETCGHAA